MSAEKTKKEIAVIDFTKFDIAQLPELKGKKKEITDVIKANPVVEVIDNASYELAKKSRTAVKTLRTSLEKEKKDVNDRIKNNVLLVVSNEYDSLIANVRNDENARQEPITIWEEKKENERLEKLRLEQERVDNIKKSIQEFANHWNTKISLLTFVQLDEFETALGEAFVNFDRGNLAEYEVLFDDQKLSIYAYFEAMVKHLTEQEEVRLEKIKLAEEREKQRVENEKIAEEQRIEREKFEAEQKATAEKQRIAQEQFLKEKKEFEEKQAEAKYQERKKFLVDEDYWGIYLLTECGEEESVAKGKLLNYTDEQFNGKFKEAIVKAKTPINEIEVVEEVVKSDEFANYQEDDTREEATKGHSTRLKTNTPAVEKELTFKDIIERFYVENDSNIQEWSKNKRLVLEYNNWLSENYNVPTPKN